MTQNLPPAGWYADPHDPNQQRYFDGTQWTEHRLPTGTGGGQGPTESWHQPPANSPSPATIGLSSPGATLSAAWTAMTKRFGSLVGVALMPLVVYLLGAVAVLALGFAAFDGFEPSSSEAPNNIGLFLAAAIVFFVLLMIASTASQLMTARILLGQHRDQRVTIGKAWRDVRRRVLPILGTFIGLGVLFTIVYVILIAIFFATGLRVRAMFLVFLVLMPLAIYAMVKLAFFVIAAAADQRGNFVAASTQVSKGRFWGVLGRLVLLGLAPIVAILPLQIVSIGISGSGAALAVLFVLMMIANLLSGIFMMSGMAKIYLDSGGPTDIALPVY